jgi:hypothetical protein
VVVDYVDETWLIYNKQIVSAWVDQHPHFGNTKTGVEGAHSMLKTYLQLSTGDVRSVYQKITLLLDNQHRDTDWL